MKIHCNVEVYNRATPYMLKGKSQRSLLTIGRQSNKNDLYIFLQTQKNKQGTKYKINDNIEQVFMKFVNDGKATIRLIHPCHDLIIQSNVILLKSFLRVLKLGLSKKIDLFIPIISNLNLKNMSSKSKVKVIVKKNSEYPTLEGFPKTTEELFLSGLNKKSFDRQILKLQNLKVLILSNNKITSLPKDLGCLPHLQKLDLSHNYLGKSTQSKWSWLNQVSIKDNLLFLDVADNLLLELPKQIGKLNVLEHLDVSQNVLTHLPQSIGTLQKLRFLFLTTNNLLCLPGSLKNIRLTFLDISNNPFSNTENYICNIGVPSLVEYSARKFLKSRRMYDSSLMPFMLVDYLDEAKYCSTCGNACFNCYIRKFLQLDLGDISCEVKLTLQGDLVFDCYFCSVKCSRNIQLA